MKNFYVSAGGRNFPINPIRVDFEAEDVSEAYLSLLTKIRENNLRIDELSLVTWDGFNSGDYALFYVDLSKYTYDGSDIDVKDLHIEIEFDPEPEVIDDDDPQNPVTRDRGVDIFSVVEWYQELVINVAGGKTLIQKVNA